VNSLVQDAQKAARRVGLPSDTIVINGGRPLRGTIDVRGAKNLVTKAMVASLLGDTKSILRDVPDISDVSVVASLLEAHGVTISGSAETGILIFDPTNVASANSAEIDALSGSSRIPILFCGPLLHRLGHAFIPDLGGCRIGDRPIDFHLDALRKFGAVVDKLPSGIDISAPNGLHGAKIEIMDLIAVLQKMGAIISVEPNRVILIEGVDSLKGYDHRALFDRNEAASWASAALATGGDITCKGAKQQDMMTFLNVFRKIGGAFDIEEDGIRFYHPGGDLKPVVIETDVHPGFMTDWQQPLIIALTQAIGTSIVHETVYEDRFGFTDALVEMGANIQVHKHGLEGGERRVPRRPLEQAAVIIGPTKLHGSEIVVPDLRGGFSHLIAALTAEGRSTVSNVGLIGRGYGDFVAKLEKLGADFSFEV
jgi:UDP-N-acetylglucosamine 1-carboxyvinyltransferase